MARFHINDSGDAGACRAEKGGCPFGTEKEHFPSLEAARMAYETRMAQSSFSPPMLQPPRDMFISVLTSTQDVLTESFPENLAGNLEPGDYIAQYYDAKTQADRYIKIRVGADASVGYEEIPRFQKLSSSTSTKTLDAFRAAGNSYRDMNVDPIHCAKNKIDHITLMESSKGFERIASKYDLTQAEDVVMARRELEDIERALEHDLAIAERDNRVSEFNALTAAKEPLSKLLDSLRG